jgi:hypothetical protein
MEISPLEESFAVYNQQTSLKTEWQIDNGRRNKIHKVLLGRPSK